MCDSKFRESNGSTKEITKYLVDLTYFFPVRVNYSFFHSVIVYALSFLLFHFFIAVVFFVKVILGEKMATPFP